MTFTHEKVHIRAALPSDTEPLLQIVCAAFGIDTDAARPLFYQDPYYDLSLKRLLTTPTRGLVSCLTVIPSALRLGTATVPIAGIAGVATHPNYQRQGYATRLLHETNRAFAAGTDYALTALFPYSEAYYRKLGWETATRAQTWHGFPPESDPSLPIHVRPVRPETDTDRFAIRHLHDHAPIAQTGMARRDSRRWRILEHLTPAWHWYVCEHRGHITGYVACQPVTGDEPILRIHEIIAADSRARDALLGFLARLMAPHTFAAWTAAPGQYEAFGLPAPPLSRLTPEPGMMLRIVNLAAALHQLHPAFAPVLAETGSAITVFATDALLPENERPVRLAAARVTPDDVCEDDWLRADIRTLARLYTGHTLPSEAAAQGHLAASSGDALALADRLFPLRQPHIAPADQF